MPGKDQASNKGSFHSYFLNCMLAQLDGTCLVVLQEKKKKKSFITLVLSTKIPCFTRIIPVTLLIKYLIFSALQSQKPDFMKITQRMRSEEDGHT
jgi:hypothetical protein